MRTPECNPDDDRLSALVDGDLGDRDRRLVAQHVLVCPECSRSVGRLIATKRLVEGPELACEPPVGFWEQTRRRLDEVDGLRAQVSWIPPQARRLVAIAAIGLILISGAVIMETALLPSLRTSALLVQAHGRLTEVAWAGMPAGGVCSAVSVAPAQTSWRPVSRALLRIDGRLVVHTCYQVGRCPVSVFDGPPDWQPLSPGEILTVLPNGLEIGRTGDTSLVSWEADGTRSALVARTTPEHLVELAGARPTLTGRSPGL